MRAWCLPWIGKREHRKQGVFDELRHTFGFCERAGRISKFPQHAESNRILDRLEILPIYGQRAARRLLRSRVRFQGPAFEGDSAGKDLSLRAVDPMRQSIGRG
jgi:hypothetical protein